MVILPTAAPAKPTAAAVSLDTLVMKQDDTVTDFPPNSDKWQATRREDAAETGKHLQVAAAVAHDA
jgi:hypothetical protein